MVGCLIGGETSSGGVVSVNSGRSTSRRSGATAGTATRAGVEAFAAPATLAALSLAAAAKGLNIPRLALYEPPFEVPGITDGAPKDMLTQLKTMVAEDRRGDAVKYFMKIVGVPSFGIFMMTLFPIWKKLKAVAHTLPYDIAILDGFALPEERAKSVKTPTLVAGGTKSQVMLRNSVKKLAEVMPNNQFKMLEGQTHNVSEKAIGPVLIEFFKSSK